MNDQPNYIIFKLYRNSHFSDEYFRLIINEYEMILKNLDSAAKKHNRKLIFTSSFGDNDANFFVNTPYLEVLYNGELPQEERDLYIGLVKKLFSDGDSICRHVEAYTPELIVRFSKLPSDDTFEVISESCPQSIRDGLVPLEPDNTKTPNDNLLSIVSPIKY